MSPFIQRSLRILGLSFCIVLVACGARDDAGACYPLNDIEQRAEIAFLPTDTVRLNSRASMSEATSQSSYRGVVRIVMGSMQNTSTFFQMYSDYLQQQGWSQNIAHPDEIMWSKDALTLSIRSFQPDEIPDIPASSKQTHRTWYVLLFGELKGSECPAGTPHAK